MPTPPQIEAEIREVAGLLSAEDITGTRREELRARLHRIADRLRSHESPYLTIAAAARRYGIDRKEIRHLIDVGIVQTVTIAGRERVDMRSVEI
jgi:hypothetical protein